MEHGNAGPAWITAAGRPDEADFGRHPDGWTVDTTPDHRIE
ncbi:hypothetical protein [Amycolatopsis pigmentata]|uniref:Uncharacterized protein n=1 Tax=Amycolatopsis pigmentata TaxID=450801 RepID=A0ABW5FQH5_9PSEU